jgi:hypothetical protein
VLNERFPTESEVRPLERRMTKFLIGKTIAGVGWTGGVSDVERTPYFSCSDGTYFESLNLVSVPGAVCSDWGTANEQIMQDDEESNVL